MTWENHLVAFATENHYVELDGETQNEDDAGLCGPQHFIEIHQLTQFREKESLTIGGL